ncbi:ammonia-forming cytochrome c nitrite reductase subunit c552 [Campylobacter sp. RM16192]|uniref:ammonia-forming cytochrome c nitrite reductase subunit c552 n=1 Tax=Campylobacter sp. RM16192 TaxID=1660080 RepID=UPI0014518624|nr:ammonia-forming cytochrome c nitrite reductase subunit c552 [Campylobacter sp. RM16192]QCD52075.1 formate-dependent nitrite reductase NrfAH, periplasmic pentaheme cytochrome c subunit [Campylobacter sp. RM16192]
MKNKLLFSIIFIIAVIGGAGMFALFSDISEKKAQERHYPLMLNKVSDLNPDIREWGKNFPTQYDDTVAMKDIFFETPFAGSVPYSKLMRWPAATVFWQGYAFAVDYNRPRLHFYSQIDQIETMRNNKEYLNAHGLPAFNGQPGFCVNCHTGHLTAIINDPSYTVLRTDPTESSKQDMPFFDIDKENGQARKEAWAKMNAIPYFDVMKMVEEKYGKDAYGGSHLGSSCADCHHPDDMSLRVTRPGFVNAMVKRGYEADLKQGIKATRAEMRNYVCMQCHVEYYPGKQATLVFPWSKWPKDEPFKIEMFDQHFDEMHDKGLFLADYKHKQTDAKMIKMQHPEAELHTTSIHARSGVTCVDCHMPYKRVGATKVTNHIVQTPFADITASCKTCHMQSEDELKERISFIQNRHAHELRKCENDLLSLIEDLKTARVELAKHSDFSGLAPDEQKKSISEALKEPLWMHRKAHIRWDFAFSENSYGFHGPQEAARIIGQCQSIAREGQLHLANTLSKYGITIALTQTATIPEPPAKIELHHGLVGTPPSDRLKKLDEDVKNLNFK